MPGGRTPATGAADPGWLELRREADERARDAGTEGLVADLVSHLASAGGGSAVRVVDVGAGTGSNHRYLAPRLPFPQRWTALDHDPGLLACPDHGAARTVLADVADLGDVLAGLPGEGPVLVTCSALLDVLTADQLRALGEAVLDAGCPALLSLSVTGRVTWSPPDREDPLLGAAFDGHQRRAGRPGPGAAERLARALRAGGASVRAEATPWRLDSGAEGTPGQGGPEGSPGADAELLGRWLDERVEAAGEQAPELVPVLTAWRDRRQAQLAEGSLSVVVDHVDLLVLPPST